MLAGNFSHAGPGGTVDSNVANFLVSNPFFQPNAALAAQGIIDPSKIDAVAKNYIAKGLIAVAPSSGVPGACDAFCSGTLNAQGSNIDNFNEFTARLDYNMSEKDHFNGTIGGRRFNQSRPLPAGGPDFPLPPCPTTISLASRTRIRLARHYSANFISPCSAMPRTRLSLPPLCPLPRNLVSASRLTSPLAPRGSVFHQG